MKKLRAHCIQEMPVTICPEYFFYLRIQRLKHTQHYCTDQIQKNEMGGACGTHGGDETFTSTQDFGEETLREEVRWKT